MFDSFKLNPRWLFAVLLVGANLAMFGVLTDQAQADDGRCTTQDCWCHHDGDGWVCTVVQMGGSKKCTTKTQCEPE